MFCFQARAYLHREYIPFIPLDDYDIAKGPYNDSQLRPLEAPVPKDWWYNSTVALLYSAQSVTKLHFRLVENGLAPDAYPFAGFCLMTSATVHMYFSIYSWESWQKEIRIERSKLLLRQDLDAINILGQYWELAASWASILVRTISGQLLTLYRSVQ